MRWGIRATGWTLLALLVVLAAVIVPVEALRAHGAEDFNRWVGWATVAALPIAAVGAVLIIWDKISKAKSQSEMHVDNIENTIDPISTLPTRTGAGQADTTQNLDIRERYVSQGEYARDFPVDSTDFAAIPVALRQLPSLITGFAGRETELAKLISLLNPNETTETIVVSALSGLAGVGKTALAIQAAHAVHKAGWFPGGTLFINMHGYDKTPVDVGQALYALLTALHVVAEAIPVSSEERAATYRSALAQISDPILIILDNASSEAQVRLLFPDPGPHRTLITSRNNLGGLDARVLDVAVLGEEAAVAVLDTALQLARRGDDRISANPEGARRLARICGGLPLALQIAAALMRAEPTCTVTDMAHRLDDAATRLEMLRYDDGSGVAAPSVVAAFELSYRKLDKVTARIFRMLPIHPGTDLPTAAVAVLADLPQAAVHRALSDLARAHLIDSTAGRWRMHDLLRLYAQQLSKTLVKKSIRTQAYSRLLHYYLKTAQIACDNLDQIRASCQQEDTSKLDEAAEWLDAEVSNLIAAIEGAEGKDNINLACQLSDVVESYLMWRRRFHEWLAILKFQLDVAIEADDSDLAASVLSQSSVALRRLRRFDDAIYISQRALTLFREIGDRHGEGRTLMNLGVGLYYTERYQEAIAAFQESLPILRETNQRDHEAGAIDNLGAALRAVGRPEEAIKAHQNAASMFREIGDFHGEGMAWGNLGNLLQEAGRFEEAIAAHQQDIAACQKVGERWDEAQALHNLGVVLHAADRQEEAITAFRIAANIHREVGDQYEEVRGLNILGTILAEVGRHEDAEAAFQAADAITSETGRPVE